LRAEVVRIDPPFTEPSRVALSFVLLNDSEEPIDVRRGEWKIVLNGVELKDSEMIFGSGPESGGGYSVLQPGESYEFGKGLPLDEYFPLPQTYEIYWKGHGFRSSTDRVSVGRISVRAPGFERGSPVAP
jgi:hypothetical protein